MLKVTMARMRQGQRAIAFPAAVPPLPDRFRGRPVIDPERCRSGCAECVEICPTDALSVGGSGLELDLGRCIFCGDCVTGCPEGAVSFTTDYRLAVRRREDLQVLPGRPSLGETLRLATALEEKSHALLGRSLKLRQVSAGGCNACEADTNVLGTVVFDLGRFGIQFVASPRHADGLLITGPVTENMRPALIKTWEAVPPPRLVIAVGACAIAGGPYIGHPEAYDGASSLLPVDLFIPGCPPHPLSILDGLLRLIGRLEEKSK